MTEEYKKDLEIMKHGLVTIKDGEDLQDYLMYYFTSRTPSYVFGLHIAASQQIMDEKIAEMMKQTKLGDINE
jgi:hypothetical protein